jgi:hypothetical protein
VKRGGKSALTGSVRVQISFLHCHKRNGGRKRTLSLLLNLGLDGVKTSVGCRRRDSLFSGGHCLPFCALHDLTWSSSCQDFVNHFVNPPVTKYVLHHLCTSSVLSKSGKFGTVPCQVPVYSWCSKLSTCLRSKKDGDSFDTRSESVASLLFLIQRSDNAHHQEAVIDTRSRSACLSGQKD